MPLITVSMLCLSTAYTGLNYFLKFFCSMGKHLTSCFQETQAEAENEPEPEQKKPVEPTGSSVPPAQKEEPTADAKPKPPAVMHRGTTNESLIISMSPSPRAGEGEILKVEAKEKTQKQMALQAVATSIAEFRGLV